MLGSSSPHLCGHTEVALDPEMAWAQVVDITNSVVHMIPSLPYAYDTDMILCAALLPGGDHAEVLVGAGEGVWCGGQPPCSSGARLFSPPRHSVVAIQITGLASPALSTWSPGTQHSVGSAAG